MKPIIITALLMAAIACRASEKDYAFITAIQIEAQTTENTFGKVIVSATITNGMEGAIFTSLSVETKGQRYSVPQDQLSRAARVYYSTLTISSEVGYPQREIGPYLYVRFDGHDGTKPQEYRLVFDSTGFKELKAKDIQQDKFSIRGKPRR